MIAICARQEEKLVFDTFNAEMAWALGNRIRDAVAREEGNAVIDITVNGIRMFACAVGRPVRHNETWIARKRNTAMEFGKSSLRVTRELALMNKTLEQRGLSEQAYALSGGAFPIIVRGIGVIGTAVCSGLPQLHDHQHIADAMADMLGKEIESVA